MTTGQIIYENRRKQGMTQEELAERLGVSRQAVSKWEQDTAFPETETILQLCKLFHLSADELLFGNAAQKKSDEGEKANVCMPWHFEYVSKTKLFGIPLVHVNYGVGFYRAKGIVAIGNLATGVIAIGGIAVGLLSIGGLALGLLLAFGGLALGGLALGGVALGALVFGGIAVGVLTIGGLSIGWFSVGGCAIGHIALGGYAQGYLAVGQVASGTHAFFAGDGAEMLERLSQFVNEELSPVLADWVMLLARGMVQGYNVPIGSISGYLLSYHRV